MYEQIIENKPTLMNSCKITEKEVYSLSISCKTFEIFIISYTNIAK